MVASNEDRAKEVEAESFEALYEAWLGDRARDNEELAHRIERTYRAAWMSDDVDLRVAVISFILFRRHSDGYDLVLEAIRSESEYLATHALTLVTSLLAKGAAFEGAVRDAIHDFSVHHPRREDLSSHAASLLAKTQD